MRYGVEHKQQTRERVLRAAAKQMRERGPHGVALASVMSEVGLTHGGFYAHFKSKDAFLAATVEQMFDDSPAPMLRGKDDQTAHETLSNFVDFYLSQEHRDKHGACCPLPFLCADAPRLHDDLQRRIAQGVAGMIKLVERHLGTLGHLDPENMASAIVSQIIGAVILARAEPDLERSNALLARTRLMVRLTIGLENDQ